MGPTELTTTPLHFTLKICWFYIWENVLVQFQGFPTNHVLNSATNSHLQSTFLSLLWGVCIEALNVKFMVRRLVQQPSILMFCLATHRPTFHFFISKVLETMTPAWSAPQVFPYEEFLPHSNLEQFGTRVKKLNFFLILSHPRAINLLIGTLTMLSSATQLFESENCELGKISEHMFIILQVVFFATNAVSNKTSRLNSGSSRARNFKSDSPFGHVHVRLSNYPRNQAILQFGA